MRDEADWLPSTLDDLAEVMRLLDAHHSWPEIYGVTDWLVRKAKGWPDPTSSATRSKYRRMLRELTQELEPVQL